MFFEIEVIDQVMNYQFYCLFRVQKPYTAHIYHVLNCEILLKIMYLLYIKNKGVLLLLPSEQPLFHLCSWIMIESDVLILTVADWYDRHDSVIVGEHEIIEDRLMPEVILRLCHPMVHDVVRIQWCDKYFLL